MFRIVSVLLALSLVAMPSGAQTAMPPQLQAATGEIVLSGTVKSIDIVNSRLTLQVTSFTGASGTTRQLPQPKTKLVHIGYRSQFIETGGINNPSLGDVALGAAVQIAGKESGDERLFAARRVRWTSPEPALPPDPATPAAIAPLLPQQQQAKGVALRVIDAGFASYRSLIPSPYIETRPIFHFKYRLNGPKVTAVDANNNPRTLNDLVVIRRLYGPAGQFLPKPGTGPLDPKNPGAGGAIAYAEGVDPTWSHIVAEFEVLDPNAPPSAPGIITSSFTFDDVPVPGQVGKKLDVVRNMTTELGTQITLDSVEGRLNSEEPVTHAALRYVPPANIPDLKARVEVEKVASDGTPWKTFPRGGGWADPFISADFDSLGPPNAKAMSLTFKIKEMAPLLQQRQWYSRIRVSIPVVSLLGPTYVGDAVPKRDAATIVAEATGDNVRIQAEHIQSPNIDSRSARLWVKSEGVAPNEFWMVRAGSGTTEKGQPISAFLPDMERTLFWREDGEQVAPNEYANVVEVRGTPLPEKIDLNLKLEKAKRFEYWSRLQDLPLPKPGTTIEVPEGEIEDDVLVVKRVVYFHDPTELPGFAGQNNLPLKEGVAVVLEIRPLLQHSDIQIYCRSATDNAGCDLGEYMYSVYDADRTRNNHENTLFRTVLLPVPAPGIKRFEIQMQTVQTAWSGQTQMVDLKNIPVKNREFAE
jgi:hypothetical protein